MCLQCPERTDDFPSRSTHLLVPVHIRPTNKATTLPACVLDHMFCSSFPILVDDDVVVDSYRASIVRIRRGNYGAEQEQRVHRFVHSLINGTNLRNVTVMSEMPLTADGHPRGRRNPPCVCIPTLASPRSGHPVSSKISRTKSALLLGVPPNNLD